MESYVVAPVWLGVPPPSAVVGPELPVPGCPGEGPPPLPAPDPLPLPPAPTLSAPPPDPEPAPQPAPAPHAVPPRRACPGLARVCPHAARVCCPPRRLPARPAPWVSAGARSCRARDVLE